MILSSSRVLEPKHMIVGGASEVQLGDFLPRRRHRYMLCPTLAEQDIGPLHFHFPTRHVTYFTWSDLLPPSNPFVSLDGRVIS